jgi:hypothetical protein
MDLTTTIQPKSDQLNADDLMTGPMTVTITDVRKGSVEQPVNVVLEEFPRRPYRPSKSMRRVLVAAWGKDSRAYIGRQLTLYRDPEVRFGGEPVGGIKISHMSHLEKPLHIALTVARGKRAQYTVQPLIEATRAGLTDAQIEAATTIDELRAMWSSASEIQQQQITRRVDAMRAGVDELTGEVSE